jgi:hypothetical protein
MAKLPTYEEMGKKVAEAALNEIYGGKTIREWIEVLVKQKPWEGEDCISRQAVLDIVNNPLNIRLDEIIKKLPPVTPQQKIREWIPVTEKLPEKDMPVLATDGTDMFVAWHYISFDFFDKKNVEGWSSYDEQFIKYAPIIAWMPLPEPYEEEKRGAE